METRPPRGGSLVGSDSLPPKGIRVMECPLAVMRRINRNMATDAKLYEWHVANIRSVEIALKHAALSCRQAIAERNVPANRSFVSLYAFLLGAWAETRLRKLLYENPGLDEGERNKVLGNSSQIEQWSCVTELGFRKHYHVPKATLSENSLPFIAYARFCKLNEMLKEDLRGVIEVRNKLAHGQWVYPLNNKGFEVETAKYRALKDENLPSLQYKKAMVASLANIVHDLIVSPATLDRDFDEHYRHIANTRSNLRTRSYAKYEQQLVAKRDRGIAMRRSIKA